MPSTTLAAEDFQDGAIDLISLLCKAGLVTSRSEGRRAIEQGEDILYLNPQDERNNILYYLMKPIEDKKEKIYVPVSNSDSRLRSCMTKEKAWNLIKRIPEIPTAWTNNEKMREQNYKAAIKANDPEALVAIIKMIYERKQKRLAQGKKCTATDARYFQMAENLLYMELGVALGKPKEEICKTIINYINQCKQEN